MSSCVVVELKEGEGVRYEVMTSNDYIMTHAYIPHVTLTSLKYDEGLLMDSARVIVHGMNQRGELVEKLKENIPQLFVEQNLERSIKGSTFYG